MPTDKQWPELEKLNKLQALKALDKGECSDLQTYLASKNVTDAKATQLLARMFEFDPEKRATIDDVLNDPYLTDPACPPCAPEKLPRLLPIEEWR